MFEQNTETNNAPWEKNSGKEIRIEGESRVKPLIGALLVFVAVAVYVFLARPIAQEVSTARDILNTKKQETEDLQAKITQFESAQEDLDLSTEVQRLEILKTVPAEMKQDSVIRDLVEIADTYKVNLNSMSFGQGTSGKEGVSVLKINSSLEGDYDDLTRFLQGIEQNARLLRVNTINVQISSVSSSDVKRATFSLAMEAFFQAK